MEHAFALSQSGLKTSPQSCSWARYLVPPLPLYPGAFQATIGVGETEKSHSTSRSLFIHGSGLDPSQFTEVGEGAFTLLSEVLLLNINRLFLFLKRTLHPSLFVPLVQVELATGQFPYKNCKTDFEVLTKVLQEDPPLLPNNMGFSVDFQSFVKDWWVNCHIKYAGLGIRTVSQQVASLPCDS